MGLFIFTVVLYMLLYMVSKFAVMCPNKLFSKYNFSDFVKNVLQYQLSWNLFVPNASTTLWQIVYLSFIYMYIVLCLTAFIIRSHYKSILVFLILIFLSLLFIPYHTYMKYAGIYVYSKFFNLFIAFFVTLMMWRICL